MPACMGKVTVEPMVTMLMLSTPAATTRSCVPDITAWAAKWTACWDDPHCRSTGWTPARDPFRLPIAVRTAPAMNASAITASVRGLPGHRERLTRLPSVAPEPHGTSSRAAGQYAVGSKWVRKTAGSGGGHDDRTHLAGTHRRHRRLWLDALARQDEAKRVR